MNNKANPNEKKVTWRLIWAAMENKTRRLFVASCLSLLAAALSLGFGLLPHASLYPFHFDWLALPWLLVFVLFSSAGGLLQMAAQKIPPKTEVVNAFFGEEMVRS